MKYCNGCKTNKLKIEFSKCNSKKDKLQTQCKLCAAMWRFSNKSRIKTWYSDNRKNRLLYMSTWKKQNSDKHCEHQARRRAKKLERMLSWGKQYLKLDIKIWYTRAKLATVFMGEEYQVDHIIPLQGKNVSGLHVPWNLQILTKSENSSKGNKHAAT